MLPLSRSSMSYLLLTQPILGTRIHWAKAFPLPMPNLMRSEALSTLLNPCHPTDSTQLIQAIYFWDRVRLREYAVEISICVVRILIIRMN